MPANLKQDQVKGNVIGGTRDVFGEKIGVIGKVFGCWHKNLTRPFSAGRQYYRACLECGARRRFDAESFKTFGSFYYPPTVSSVDN